MAVIYFSIAAAVPEASEVAELAPATNAADTVSAAEDKLAPMQASACLSDSTMTQLLWGGART